MKLDLIGRIISERLSAALGKPVIVENKPGAAGNVGAAEAARAAPDGHTALLTLFSIVTQDSVRPGGACAKPRSEQMLKKLSICWLDATAHRAPTYTHAKLFPSVESAPLHHQREDS
jgi:hypothetical protein